MATGLPTAVEVNGRRFASIVEAAKHYHIKSATLSWRLRQGMKPEDAVAKPYHTKRKEFTAYNSRPVTVGGIPFPSIRQACRYFGIDEKRVSNRISRHGWEVERAILTPKCGLWNEITFEGRRYKTEAEMCRAHGVDPVLYRHNKFKGMGTREALTTPAVGRGDIQTTINGVTYRSRLQAIKNEGTVSVATARFRMKCGEKLEDAITRPADKRFTTLKHKALRNERRELMELGIVK